MPQVLVNLILRVAVLIALEPCIHILKLTFFEFGSTPVCFDQEMKFIIFEYL